MGITTITKRATTITVGVTRSNHYHGWSNYPSEFSTHKQAIRCTLRIWQGIFSLISDLTPWTAATIFRNFLALALLILSMEVDTSKEETYKGRINWMIKWQLKLGFRKVKPKSRKLRVARQRVNVKNKVVNLAIPLNKEKIILEKLRKVQGQVSHT